MLLPRSKVLAWNRLHFHFFCFFYQKNHITRHFLVMEIQTKAFVPLAVFLLATLVKMSSSMQKTFTKTVD